MWNAHKEIRVCTSLNSSNWKGHEAKETLATTVFGHERLQA